MKRTIIIVIFYMLTIFSPPLQAEYGDVNIHGYLSQGYLKSNHNNFYANTEDGTFEFNEMGINFSTELTSKLHISTQFFARDLGRLGNDKIMLCCGFADYKYNNYLGCRAGMMKLTLGFYNDIRDLDVLNPNIFFPNGVYDESWRDILSSIKGIGIYGHLDTGILGTFKYLFQIGLIKIAAESGASNLLEDRVPYYQPGISAEVKNVQMDHLNSCAFILESPFSIKGLRTGITAFDAYYKSDTMLSTVIGNIELGEHELTVDVQSYTASIEYIKGNCTFAYEYMVMFFKLGFGVYTPPDPDFSTLAYYGSVSYIFSELIEGYFCYSMHYDDRSDRNGNGLEGIDHKYRRWIEEYILSVRFNLNENWILKLETHINDGAAVLLNKDQDEPEILEDGRKNYPYKRHWMLYAVKLSFSF